MSSSTLAQKNRMISPLLPFWLVVALLPFWRSAEFGTFLCLVGVIVAWRREGGALLRHADARLLLALLACYIGAALLSSFTAMEPRKSWTTVLALLRYVPLGLYACHAIRGERGLQGFYVAVAVVIAFWTLDAWMQMLTGWSLRGYAEPQRISGLFGADDPKLGPTLSVLSPLALWVARKRWGLRGLIVAFLLLLGPVMLSGSRGAWICFGVVALLFAWREAGSPLRFMAACAIGAVILLAAGGIAWKTSTRFDTRMQHTLTALGGSEQDINEAMTGRLDIWRNSLAMIEAHPFTGVGVRDFRYAYPHYAPANDHFMTAETCGEGEGACHAHQIVLEILTETGGIGLLLWVTAIVVAWRAWRRADVVDREGAFPVTVCLVAMLFPLNTHLAFYSAWWGLLFAWLLGLWCAALYAQAKEQSHGA
ncbi:O-antigen ligase family protein [Dyella psychrodurans]|uniref:O-antigen ligase family protein n=1 Tax=Dyella psychrodurans TaxID=1927960 RepID=A0A370WX82_9GAMM|nr:O-antigen ligase family protein [Dyella psychrodurans]RDS80637.1 O-antigen ligase family protein [Dyella psychrodurans]